MKVFWSKSTGTLKMLIFVVTFQVGNTVCTLAHISPPPLFFLKGLDPEKHALRMVSVDSLKLVHAFCCFGDIS